MSLIIMKPKIIKKNNFGEHLRIPSTFTQEKILMKGKTLDKIGNIPTFHPPNQITKQIKYL